PVPGAVGYRIYGRTQEAEQFVALSSIPSFTDDGQFSGVPTWLPVAANTTGVTTDQRGLARKLNALHAAAKALGETEKSRACMEMIEAMAGKGYLPKMIALAAACLVHRGLGGRRTTCSHHA